MHIITPISHLSKEKGFFQLLLKFGSLEVRDHSKFKGYEKFVTMYHSELELTQEWSQEKKNIFLNFVHKFINLKGISFHVVTRYDTYEIVKGIAYGRGNALDENTLLKNAEINVKWLKEKLPNIILMVENNNDLGSDAYEIVTDAKFLNKLVTINKINFLYDHAHAIISAYNKNMEFNDYFSDLPTSEIRQIHLSEPSFHKGVAYDSHLAPSNAQIKFCLNKFKQVDIIYTIEFYESLHNLEISLKTLKKAIIK